MNPRSVADFKDLVKMNRKGDVESVKYSADPPMPDPSVLKDLKEICPKAAFFSLIPKLDPEETDSASEDEDEPTHLDPITCLYSQTYASLAADELQKKGADLIANLNYTSGQRENLELVTRNQSISPLWYEHRKGRITASKAHR